MKKQSEKPPVPEDHPIQEIWEDNKKTLVDLAKEGDRDAIQAVLKQFKYCVSESYREWEAGCYLVTPGEHYRVPREFMEYLLKVFSEISHNRKTPNEAFNWTNGGKGRPKKTYKGRNNEVRLAVRAADLIEELGEDNKNEAFELAAEEFYVSKSQAIQAHKKYILEVK
ncbi:MAG: hypothetical protein JAY67_17205 [Candidatus Thiodiazotropha taylori]|nr:hypothetical protein [Candidatus Thiodiazotropha taylori]MCG7927263.1 hypothetical protein [Candidatus Thiodiazotropha taylori]